MEVPENRKLAGANPIFLQIIACRLTPPQPGSAEFKLFKLCDLFLGLAGMGYAICEIPINIIGLAFDLK